MGVAILARLRYAALNFGILLGRGGASNAEDAGVGGASPTSAASGRGAGAGSEVGASGLRKRSEARGLVWTGF